MDYKITVLTISSKIPVGTLGASLYEPWYLKPVRLPDAQLSTITLSDSDGNFENIASASAARLPESEQRLVSAATFGYGSSQVTIPAGTQLSFAYGSIIQDQFGNKFIATFPNTGTTTVNGTMVGGYTSVLILPMQSVDASGAPLVDATGAPVYPVFNPANTFTYAGRQSFGSKNYGTKYTYAVDCFAQGTLIETMFGPRAVQTLRVGDMIATRDNGMRWLSWIGSVHLDGAKLDLAPNLRPIRVAAGALGGRLPRRDLVLSPQHRLLVRSTLAQKLFGADEVLVAVKHLVGLPGIGPAPLAAEGVTYWHLLFDGHEVLRAEGAWAESLYLGPQALHGVGEAGRREILALFPHVRAEGPPPPPARRLLSGREGRDLAARLGRKGRVPVEA